MMNPSGAQLPTVSVIVVNWNRKTLILDLLEGLKLQSYERIETVVVDNASQDGSADAIKLDYPQVVLIRKENNVGLYRAFNQAVDASTGEIIVGLDCDTVPSTSSFIEDIVKKFQRDHIDLIACCVKQYGTGNPMWDNPRHSTVGTEEAGYRCAWFNASGFAIARKAFLECGGYDARFFVYEGEWDLMWNFHRKGYVSAYYPRIVVYHRAPNYPRAGTEYWERLATNRLLLYWKYYPIPYAALRTLIPSITVLIHAKKLYYSKILPTFLPNFGKTVSRKQAVPLRIVLQIFQLMKSSDESDPP